MLEILILLLVIYSIFISFHLSLNKLTGKTLLHIQSSSHV